jgi:hypothetical protein
MRRVLVASVLVTAFLLAPAAASARRASGWVKPQVIVPVGTATYSPAVATAPNGTTVVVWDEANPRSGKFRLLAGTRLLSGKIKINKLGPMSGAFPQASIAVGGDGTFAVAWASPAKGGKSRVAVRVWPSGKHGFGGTTILSPGNASTEQGEGDVPHVAIDDNGTVYVVWEGLYGKKKNKHYQVVERQLGKDAKKWSSTRRLSSTHAKKSATHRWSSPRRLSAVGVDSHGARVAADGNGNVAVSWIESNGAIKARVAPAGAKGFGKAQVISAASYGVNPPSIGESENGKVALVWAQTVSSGRRIESKVTGGGTFPKRGQFLSGKGTVQYQTLALASNGSGVTAWEKTAGSGGQILARVITAAGRSWTKNVEKLTRPGVALFGTGPSAAAADGHAFVAWSQRLNNKLTVGVKVLDGRHWLKTRTFAAIPSPFVVSATSDPAGGARILGSMVWSSTSGLQIAVFR